ncbi:MAG: hypothetical protein HXY38_14655 [Chloroflexi bacterium]|nr:hypothetical protein [Chloroflexota bacterium]
MKRTLLPVFVTITIMLSACGGSAAPTQPEPAAATEPPAQPTAAPATEAPTQTETTVPATEAPTQTATTVPATEAQTASGVSYANDVLPILEAKCVKCHGGERVREGLDLRTYDSLFAGSDNGPVITAGDANDSLFVQLIVEGEMPTRGAPLTPEELQIIIDWVNQGALNN